ncbi:TMhelix containing protein [Vibrio phage 1.244.A._10N.261.54.C3]|nr:TMhelix containing protein [Vibrio phage 1.244.A._10N.261.54.C3]AUR98783.1 TMhelix containing protein [Vibrio phage 1.255.O._10N.286.45.F1]
MREIRGIVETHFELSQSYNLWWCQLIGLLIGLVRTLTDSGYYPTTKVFNWIAWSMTITLVVVVLIPVICIGNYQPKNGSWSHV